MDVVKSYSGTAENLGTSNKVASHGVTENVTVNVGKTNVINQCIVDFLTECGVKNLEYDEDTTFLWVEGLPFHIIVTGSNSYVIIYGPFNSTALVNSSSHGVVFSNYLYNFKLRFIGDPEGCFSLMISTDYTSPAFKVGSIAFFVDKGKNLINNSDVIIYNACALTTSSNAQSSLGGMYNPKVIGIGENGECVDIGHSVSSISVSDRLKTIEADYLNNPGKILLINKIFGPFQSKNVYMYPENSGLPVFITQFSDTVVTVSIGGETYISWYYGLIKCFTSL